MCAPASANYRVGLSEQNAAVFSQPAWQALKLKRIRYILAWDYAKDPGQKAEADDLPRRRPRREPGRAPDVHGPPWLLERLEVLQVRAPARRRPRAPTRRPCRDFRKSHTWIKTYAPWNEANHVSQPIAKSPKKAAEYYATLRSVCGSKCKVMAADVLDQSTVKKWLTDFIRYSKNKGRIWGLHNYKDVNRRQSKGLTTVLKTVPGEVWLTETGGITTFAPDFPT